MAKKSLQIYGPFFTNYSLARVNRGLGIALSKLDSEYEISLFGDREKIDWYPSEKDLETRPEIKKLFKEPQSDTDIVIYNNYPRSLTTTHDFNSLRGKIKLAYFAWEESIYPSDWVTEINENIHGLIVASNFTREIMQNSGVKIPIAVIPNALDDQARVLAKKSYGLDTRKNFKFLHISTAKKRKGIDVLLKAYFSEFTIKDDVVLILKTFPGPDNEVESLVSTLKTSNSPELIIINDPDLTEEELRNLHASADCEVYPTRAEGFGLPILEAMFQKVPVITTAYSGQLDFCNDENSYLIDYSLEYARDSELVNLGAKWAEPDLNHLKSLMRYLFENKDKDEVKLKTENARATAEKYTWESTAKKVIEFVKEIETTYYLKHKKIAIISPINDETGIAEYSKELYKPIEAAFDKFYFIANKDIADQVEKDTDNVKRLWSSGDEQFDETLSFIEKNDIEIIHIQYHSGNFFSTSALDNLINELKKLGKKVFLTFHAFRSDKFDYLVDVKNLHMVDRIFIHNPNDFEYASGKLKNVEYFILPTIEFKNRNKAKLRERMGIDVNTWIVASHGLMNTNKNIPEIIEAVAKLNEKDGSATFFSINAVSSNNIHSSGILEECKKIVIDKRLQNKVLFFSNFLKEEQIELLLQISDIIVFNYTEVGESASASIRKALASLNPVIVTNINMFSEFTNEVLKIKDTSVGSVYEGIATIFDNPQRADSLVQNAKIFIEKNLYYKKALETLRIYTST